MVGFLAGIVEERFRNIDRIGAVESPVLLIHGEKDSLVPCKHSEDLANKKVKGVCKLLILKDMEHNKYNLFTEIINPIWGF
jgi:fermentation-respiration switch protein FrsA (DUF1100 family)